MFHLSRPLADYFDHTLLKPSATERDIRVLCAEARDYGFHLVAINPAPVRLCKKLLSGSGVRVGAAVGFPLGQATVATKRFETVDAIKNGADEIDYVVNIAKVKDADYSYVRMEMREIVEVCREYGAVSKVIFENCYLTDLEKEKLCEISLDVQPDFLKTSTGFGPSGATVADVVRMREAVGSRVKIKAAGGVRTLEMTMDLLALGVERIGSSAGKEIVDAYSRLAESAENELVPSGKT